MGFPCGSAGKESGCNVGDLALIPGLGRSPGDGKGYPLQYSGLYSPWGRKQSDTTEPLSHDVLASPSPRSGFRCLCAYMPVCLVVSAVSDSLQPYRLLPARLLCPWDSLGKNAEVGCHALFQGIIRTQGSSPNLQCLLHCRFTAKPAGKPSNSYSQSLIPMRLSPLATGMRDHLHLSWFSEFQERELTHQLQQFS